MSTNKFQIWFKFWIFWQNSKVSKNVTHERLVIHIPIWKNASWWIWEHIGCASSIDHSVLDVMSIYQISLHGLVTFTRNWSVISCYNIRYGIVVYMKHDIWNKNRRWTALHKLCNTKCDLNCYCHDSHAAFSRKMCITFFFVVKDIFTNLI